MSSALVKLLGSFGLFGVTSGDRSKVSIHPKDKMKMIVGAGQLINLKDNEPLEGSVVQFNQPVLVLPAASLTPSRYHAIVSYNPELARAGVSITPLSLLVGPGEKDKIGLIVRASKKVDLSEFSHIFELYQLD